MFINISKLNGFYVKDSYIMSFRYKTCIYNITNDVIYDNTVIDFLQPNGNIFFDIKILSMNIYISNPHNVNEKIYNCVIRIVDVLKIFMYYMKYNKIFIPYELYEYIKVNFLNI